MDADIGKFYMEARVQEFSSQDILHFKTMLEDDSKSCGCGICSKIKKEWGEKLGCENDARLVATCKLYLKRELEK